MQKSTFYIISLAVVVLLFIDCGRRRGRENRMSSYRIRTEQSSTQASRASRTSGGKSIIKMYNDNGVYYVPCKINGMEMQFIFDTGASDISMSAAEAIVLYKHGKLNEDDFIGSQQYQIADGSIHEGMLVELKTVEIGNRKLTNVRASIVDYLDAPLLLGQSALSKFGKISIDYKRNEITFE
jgi:aspartyl protease family protein